MSNNDPENEEGREPEVGRPVEPTEDDARPLTGEPVAPMRLRPEPPRVTRLSRKVLAGLGLAASVGVGGALIYALQTRHGGEQGQELISTDNRTTPDGLAGLPKDYSGVPKLGPPLPGDLGRPILNAQNAGQPVPTPGIATPSGPVGPTPEEQRRAQAHRRCRLAGQRHGAVLAGRLRRFLLSGFAHDAGLPSVREIRTRFWLRSAPKRSSAAAKSRSTIM